MNEDMLQMARKAGFSDHSNPEMWGYMIASVEELARFAALVCADEIEACAKVCENDESQAMDWMGISRPGGYFADIIRARCQS
ncbi:MAG: hypothetical protein ACOVN4_04360 [Bosea sp. (in: a-proteobacteria)]